MSALTLNDKPAVRITGRALVHTSKAVQLDCDGDVVWVPRKCVNVELKGTVLIEEWLYDKLVGEGKL